MSAAPHTKERIAGIQEKKILHYFLLPFAQTVLKFAQVPNLQFGARLGKVCPESNLSFPSYHAFPTFPRHPGIQRDLFIALVLLPAACFSIFFPTFVGRQAISV